MISGRAGLVLALALATTAPATAAPHAPAGLDPAAFATLYARAEATHSDALVIYKDGKLAGEWYFGKPRGLIETMSATKSVVALAIGRLIADGKIKSVDEPVADFYPEWRQGKKRAITIHQLLDHTSGLQADRSTKTEIYPAADVVKLALAAELTTEPGAAFFYNNKAVNLLAGIVKLASGKRLDAYVRDALFRPLGITEFEWETDPAGNPYAMAGLHLHAADLAKLGELVLDRGMWKGKRVVEPAWLDRSFAPSQPYAPNYGLLWWLIKDFRSVVANDALIAAWRAGGDSDAFIAHVLPLKDKIFTDKDSYFAAITAALHDSGGIEAWYANTVKKQLPDGAELPGPILGYYADGSLGQYVVIIPSSHIVAVRQMRAPAGVDRDRIDAFADFPAAVRALVTP